MPSENEKKARAAWRAKRRRLRVQEKRPGAWHGATPPPKPRDPEGRAYQAGYAYASGYPE